MTWVEKIIYYHPMAYSYLLIYEPLTIFGKKKDYWNHYINFHENYWGGPSSPYGVFFGNDFENFRKSLSAYLEIDENKIEDCYFMKDDRGKYYVSLHNPPVGTYILSSKNQIPLQWFIMFNHTKKKSFSTRLDFNRIHFLSGINSSVVRLNEAIEIIKNHYGSDQKNNLSIKTGKLVETIYNGMFELRTWIQGFDPEGYILLDYGELCSFADPSFIKNENSVFEIHEAIRELNANNVDIFESKLGNIVDNWNKLSKKISNRISTTDTIQ